MIVFFPADEKAIILWRKAAAFNSVDLDTQVAIFAEKAQLAIEGQEVLKGREAIAAYLGQVLRDSAGLLREELATFRGAPALLVWRYARGEEKKAVAVSLITGLKNGLVTRAKIITKPELVTRAKSAGLMPYDSRIRRMLFLCSRKCVYIRLLWLLLSKRLRWLSEVLLFAYIYLTYQSCLSVVQYVKHVLRIFFLLYLLP